MHPHLPGNVTENDMTVLQLDSEGCIREVLKNLTLHLNDVVFRHTFVTDWIGSK